MQQVPQLPGMDVHVHVCTCNVCENALALEKVDLGFVLCCVALSS